MAVRWAASRRFSSRPAPTRRSLMSAAITAPAPTIAKMAKPSAGNLSLRLGRGVRGKVVRYHRNLLWADGRAHVDHAFDDCFPVLTAKAGISDRRKVVTGRANPFDRLLAIAVGKVLREGRSDEERYRRGAR